MESGSNEERCTVELSTPSLLITDDDKAFRETLRSVLGRFGFEMLLAEDGEQAIEIISRTKVHLALFDVHMPRMSGLEALAHLRDSGLSMPCILMSAQLDDEIREEATRMEVASVLSKPVKIHDVSLAVTETLEQAYGWTG